MATDGNPAVQMVLPMAEMVGWLRQGVGEVVRPAGLRLMDLSMQEEVRELVGERKQRQADWKANRWGSQRGCCVMMGQKVPVERPRVRSTDDQEVRVGTRSVRNQRRHFVFRLVCNHNLTDLCATCVRRQAGSWSIDGDLEIFGYHVAPEQAYSHLCQCHHELRP